MSSKRHLSRRSFLKSTAMMSAGVLLAASSASTS
ncbi:MAG: twin-arginine translocation signal domain-containing protein, partial [Caldilineaceae bacterium]|nr:twin-arginine translocation signal domain-containing protein [Caldilineaceae bacterium]